MNKMTHDEMIAVIQAHKEGKLIQFWCTHGFGGTPYWKTISKESTPVWNFNALAYRVKSEPREWYMPRVVADTNRPYCRRADDAQVQGRESNYIKLREVLEDE